MTSSQVWAAVYQIASSTVQTTMIFWPIEAFALAILLTFAFFAILISIARRDGTLDSYSLSAPDLDEPDFGHDDEDIF